VSPPPDAIDPTSLYRMSGYSVSRFNRKKPMLREMATKIDRLEERIAMLENELRELREKD
jgi:hypothetical protein